MVHGNGPANTHKKQALRRTGGLDRIALGASYAAALRSGLQPDHP
jgi:hypothetical protein